jgi:hypothetical protein
LISTTENLIASALQQTPRVRADLRKLEEHRAALQLHR